MSHPSFARVIPVPRFVRVNPGVCRVDPVRRIVPGRAGQPGLSGSSRVRWVIPSRSGHPTPTGGFQFSLLTRHISPAGRPQPNRASATQPTRVNPENPVRPIFFTVHGCYKAITRPGRPRLPWSPTTRPKPQAPSQNPNTAQQMHELPASPPKALPLGRSRTDRGHIAMHTSATVLPTDAPSTSCTQPLAPSGPNPQPHKQVPSPIPPARVLQSAPHHPLCAARCSLS